MRINQIAEEVNNLVSTRVEFATTPLKREILVQLAQENQVPLAVFLERLLHGAVETILDSIQVNTPETETLLKDLDKVLGTNLSEMTE